MEQKLDQPAFTSIVCWFVINNIQNKHAVDTEYFPLTNMHLCHNVHFWIIHSEVGHWNSRESITVVTRAIAYNH